MTMYGADVAELRSLAAQFDRAADQLDEHRTFLGNAVQHSPWLGPDAERFRGQWDSEHNARVATAARLLRDTAATVRRNADEQERVSAVDGGGALQASRSAGNISGPAWNAGGVFDSIQEAIDEVRRGALPGGVKPWDLLKTAADGAEFLGHGLPVVGHIDEAMDIYSLADKVRNGTFSVFDGADAVSMGLRHFKGVGELGAVAVDAASYAGQQALQADFSDAGRATVGNYIMDHPLDALGAAGQAVLTVGQDFVLPELQKSDFKLLAFGANAVSFDIQEAMKADFSEEGRTMVSDYVVQHPVETLQTVGESVLTVGKNALTWWN
ncbi:hypothetical protein SAMN05444745_111108 [Arthrobacter sp. OV608]|nr:hypothetical protein SAMN05444745_111108 [Arthrobacter sp. OV608]